MRVGPRIPICEDSGDQGNAAVAYNTACDEFMVVWASTAPLASETLIRGRRVGRSGSMGPFLTLRSGNSDHSPVLAYNPLRDEYPLVFVRLVSAYVPVQMDVRAIRVSADGDPLGAEMEVNGDVEIQDALRVTCNTQWDEYLVVYQNRRAGGLWEVDARRISGPGALLGPDSGVNVATARDHRSYPDVAHNADRNLYLISDTGTVTSTGATDIRAKIAPADLLGLSTGSEMHICPSGNPQDQVPLTAEHDEFIAVWLEMVSTMPTDPNIRARRLGGLGAPPRPGFDVGAEAADIFAFEPAAAFAGPYVYLTSWQRDNPGPTCAEGQHGRYIRSGQDAPAGDEFLISANPLGQTAAALACAPSGDCLLVTAWGGSGTGWDIAGHIVDPRRIYLPLVLRG
jgi:hypothetical protein